MTERISPVGRRSRAGGRYRVCWPRCWRCTARVAGRRVSVWLIVETLKQCAGNKRKAAEALNLPMPLFAAALNYAAEYPREIEADARRGKRTLEECGVEPVEA